jgi:hypothetical protein
VIVVLSMTLNACSGGNRTSPSTSVIPTTSSHAAMLSDRNALDHMFERPGGGGQARTTKSTTPVVFYRHTPLPSSPATIRTLGVYNWVVESGGHQLDGVGQVDDGAILALDYNGRVIWEVDSQYSNALGAGRFFFSSGGYVGAWSNGTLNIAQKPTALDVQYLKALQVDSQWAQAGFPGGGSGGHRPIANGASNGGAIPKISDGSLNVWVGAGAVVAGLLGLAACWGSGVCEAIVIGGAVIAIAGGIATYVRGQEQLQEASQPLAPPNPIGGGGPPGEFYNIFILGSPWTPGTSNLPPLPPPAPPGMVYDGTTIVEMCDDGGCWSEYMFYYVPG